MYILHLKILCLGLEFRLLVTYLFDLCPYVNLVSSVGSMVGPGVLDPVILLLMAVCLLQGH